MFTADLTCTTCGPITGKFVVGFLPHLDSADVVLQDSATYELRIVRCTDIAKELARKSAGANTEDVFESVLEECAKRTAMPNERRVTIGLSPDAFPPIPCPKCRKTAVHLRLHSVI
jgi:hypothetical protein